MTFIKTVLRTCTKDNSDPWFKPSDSNPLIRTPDSNPSSDSNPLIRTLWFGPLIRTLWFEPSVSNPLIRTPDSNPLFRTLWFEPRIRTSDSNPMIRNKPCIFTIFVRCLFALHLYNWLDATLSIYSAGFSVKNFRLWSIYCSTIFLLVMSSYVKARWHHPPTTHPPTHPPLLSITVKNVSMYVFIFILFRH